MARATYTDADRARVYVALQANDNNVTRTVRDTGVPASTVRLWRDEWQKNGPPALDELEQAVDDFYTEAETVRTEALQILRKKLPDATPSALVAVIGVLDDKIVRVKGLDKRQVEHKITLPSADELRELLGGFVQGTVVAARTRAEEIVEAEIVEQPRKGLPAPQS